MPKLHEIYKIIISKDVFDEACRLADASYPNEMISYLGGVKKKGVILITKIYYQHYVSSPIHADSQVDWFAATNDFLGMIHSHPDGEAIASDADRITFQYYPVHFIMGYPFMIETIKGFDSEGHDMKYSIMDAEWIKKEYKIKDI